MSIETSTTPHARRQSADSKDVGRRHFSAAEFRKRDDARREQASAKAKQKREVNKAAADEARRNPPKKESKPSRFSQLMHELTYGPIKPKVACPYCQTMGTVRIKRSRQKVGVSGSKLASAILTGGLSILATGLSRKQLVVSAYCDNCTVEWHL